MTPALDKQDAAFVVEHHEKHYGSEVAFVEEHHERHHDTEQCSGTALRRTLTAQHNDTEQCNGLCRCNDILGQRNVIGTAKDIL
eukprot:1148343-Pelagomonas_calceolata.AAC.3